MNQPTTNEVPLATLPPTYQSSTITTNPETNGQRDEQPTEDQNKESLRLRGGAGCITDCLAAIGCCCICEDCCC
ncbi:hypothetical protein BY458DRAFT_557752 [Sporodiniella umbellata]|nr:hypothetical protein BY458DRAFT_557752 [Sporodiniella umbellata]